MDILARTAHYDIQMNVTNSERFLNTAERPIPAKVFTWMRASNSYWSERKILLSLWVQYLMASGDCPLRFCYITSTSSCPCILWISQLDYYFLCRLLTGYSKLKDFWSKDLPHFTKYFLNGLLLWVLWRTVCTQVLCTALSRHSNVNGWLRTARNWWLGIVLPRKQLCKQCSATELWDAQPEILSTLLLSSGFIPNTKEQRQIHM